VAGQDAIPSVQISGLIFKSDNTSVIKTKVEEGKSYLVNLTLQAKAKNLNESSQLLLIANLKSAAAGSLSQLILIPSHGVNQRGEIVQTVQLTGLFQPSVDAESLSLSVTEKLKRAISGLSGVIQLTKINAQVLDQASLNPAVKALAAKAPAAKAPAAKAPAAKAPAAKAPAAKAPAAKSSKTTPKTK
jgi:hypothetical protein